MVDGVRPPEAREAGSLFVPQNVNTNSSRRDVNPEDNDSGTSRIAGLRTNSGSASLDTTAAETSPLTSLDSELVKAASRGDPISIRHLLAKGARVNIRNENQNTAVHEAALGGHKGAVKELLKNERGRLALAIKGAQGWTPLRCAIESKSVFAFAIVKTILEHSTREINVPSDDGQLPLWIACASRESDIAISILDQMDLRETVDDLDSQGLTLLHRACYGGVLEIAGRLLREYHADPKIKSNDAWGAKTALHYAAEWGHEDIVTLLLEYDAPLDIENSKRRTPLHLAAQNHEEGVIQLLLERPDSKKSLEVLERPEDEIKRMMDIRDHNDRTALWYLAESDKHIASAEKLLNYGANFQIRDNTENQWTALTNAPEYGSTAFMKLLLDRGAHVDSQTAAGWTPLILASYYGKYDVAKLLLDYPQKPDKEHVTNRLGSTALHEAAKKGHWDIVKLLLEYGAQPSRTTKDGETAFQLAAAGNSGEYRLVKLELFKESSKKEEDLAWLVRSKTWKTLLIILDALAWNTPEQKDALEETAFTCLASDRDRIPRWILRARLEKAALEKNLVFEKDRNVHGNWTELQWAAFLDRPNLVWWLLKYLPANGGDAMIKGARDLIRAQRERTVRKRHERRESQVSALPHGAQGTPLDPEQSERYSVTEDLLSNPPLVEGWAEPKEEYEGRVPPKTQKACCEKFDATIVDFYGQRNDHIDYFLRRTRSVWDVIYEGNLRKDSEPLSKKENLPLDESSGEAIRTGGDGKRGGPNAIMEDALKGMTTLTRKLNDKDIMTPSVDSLRYRWIHLPANNLEWMHDLAMRIYLESGRDQAQWNYLDTFIRHSWTELHGSKTSVKHMRPVCIRTSQPTTNAHSPEPSAVSTYCTAVYMPYVTFGTYKKSSMSSGVALENNRTLLDAYGASMHDDNEQMGEALDTGVDASNEGTTLDVLIEDTAHMSRQGQPCVSALHGSRTLDEFGYFSLLDTDKRDRSQVVTRYIDARPPNDRAVNPKLEWKILRVDQLWLWVIDDKTIITSSTNRLDDVDDPVADGIYDYLRKTQGKRLGESPPSSVQEMSRFITHFCIEFINGSTLRCKNGDVSTRQIFAETINIAASEEAKLFDNFRGKIKLKLDRLQNHDLIESKPHTNTPKKRWWQKVNSGEDQLQQNVQGPGINSATEKRPRMSSDSDGQVADYQSISSATELLVEVKDIRDELNILQSLLMQQKTIWDTLNERPNGQAPAEDWRRRRGPVDAIDDIEQMDQAAQRIQDSINALLGLEQNEASISQAQETINQGRTLMVFTIMTVIFLPSSFLTSFFAVDISTFPHQDGHLFWGSRMAFSLIFGVTALVCILTFLLAWRGPVINSMRRASTKGSAVSKPNGVVEAQKPAGTHVVGRALTTSAGATIAAAGLPRQAQILQAEAQHRLQAPRRRRTGGLIGRFGRTRPVHNDISNIEKQDGLPGLHV